MLSKSPSASSQLSTGIKTFVNKTGWANVLVRLCKEIRVDSNIYKFKDQYKITVFKNHLDWSHWQGVGLQLNATSVNQLHLIWILQNKNHTSRFGSRFWENSYTSAGGLVNKVSFHYRKSHVDITVCLHNFWWTLLQVVCLQKKDGEKCALQLKPWPVAWNDSWLFTSTAEWRPLGWVAAKEKKLAKLIYKSLHKRVRKKQNSAA